MSAQLQQFGEATELQNSQELVKAVPEEVAGVDACPTEEPVSSPCQFSSADAIECQEAGPVEAEAEACAENVDFINIERDDLVETLGGDDKCCFVYVLPVLDGKLYISTTPSQAALNEVIKIGTVTEGGENYQFDKDIDPVVLPNKSKWDLAKYACLLVQKYGWDNVIISDAQFEEVRRFYRSLSKPRQEQESNSSCHRKKLIFKRKAAWPRLNQLTSQLSGVLSVFKHLFVKRRRN